MRAEATLCAFMQVCEQDVLIDDTFIKWTLEVPLESSDKVIEIASKVRRASPSACGRMNIQPCVLIPCSECACW